jgi:large subunit ribosomal protein L17
MLSNMVASLIQHKRIKTTLAKAKEARRWADRVVTFGKKDSVAARRQVYKFIPRRDIIKILFDDIAPQFENRNGGYTRVVKMGRRKGDGAELAILEFVGYEDLQIEKQQKAQETRVERKRRKAEEMKQQQKPAESEEKSKKSE